MNIVIAIIVFGLIIAVHEFGHFIVAKMAGIRVNQFAIGMGPAILKKQKGETLYSLRLLPIGGYCAFEGEDEVSTDSRAFGTRSTWQKVAVLLAGAFMNIILGFILVVIATSTTKVINSTTIANFNDNAVSSNTGLMTGDEITKINDMSILIDSDIVYQLITDVDGVVSMEVKRGGNKVKLDDVTFATFIPEDGTGKQQISIDFKVYPQEKTFLNVLGYSVRKTGYVARLIWISLVDLVNGKYGFNELSGPVAVVGAIEQASSMGMSALLNLVIFITINVGIFNLLPLPALDGGRIVVRIFEGVTKKTVKPEVEGVIHFVGLALLMVMMVAVTFNDVRKLF